MFPFGKENDLTDDSDSQREDSLTVGSFQVEQNEHNSNELSDQKIYQVNDVHTIVVKMNSQLSKIQPVHNSSEANLFDIQNSLSQARIEEFDSDSIVGLNNNDQITNNHTKNNEILFELKDSEEFDRLFNYDVNETFQPIHELEINLGSDNLPRFSCFNHKLNLVVRSAIARHPSVKDLFKEINKFAVKVRDHRELNDICKELNCRLRIENETRWGSAFLVLEVIKKANDRGAFLNLNAQEISSSFFSLIEMYLLILKPAYALNICFQSNKTSIGEVIPKLFSMICVWEKTKNKLTPIGSQFVDLLICETKRRFKYEMNSNIYYVII